MTVDPAPRPLYYQNQVLGPEDLDAAVHYAAEKSARHALGAHTWGVGAGLAVTASQSDGTVAYWVQPGVAWDGFGRTLLVPTPVQITADLMRNVVFDPNLDRPKGGPGQLVGVWLRYREDATAPPAPAFAYCHDGGFARAIERVDIVIGNYTDEIDTQQRLDIGGRMAPPREALGAWYPPTGYAAPIIEDSSVAFQRFPGPGDASRWLVPIGVLRWKVAPPGGLGSPGTFMPPQSGDEDVTLHRRRLVGVVAGSVLGAEGRLRLRPRTQPASSVWTDEPIWLESTTRLDGDLHVLIGEDESTTGGVEFLNAAGEDAGRRLRISRHDSGGSADLRIQLGSRPSAANRMVIGTESKADPPVFKGSVVVTSNAQVGIGTDNPLVSLDVSGRPAANDEHNLGAHVAVIDNRSSSARADVLALRVRTSADRVGQDNNFITFFADTDPIGCIEADGNGVRLTSGSADFAESVPTADGEELGVGDVVAVVAGRATRSTDQASWISVVSDRAIVLGNAPMAGTANDVAVTMLGQVPVRVRGEARSGDLLAPSGDDDGAALAYSLAELPIERANQVFGEVVSVIDTEPNSVVALVGAHARSSALIAIVQRMHAGAG